MAVASLPHSVNYPQGHFETPTKTHDDKEWVGTAVGGSLLIGSFLLLTGNRRAGLVFTAAGTALALLEEKEAVRTLWNALPGYLDNAQRLLEEAQKTVDDLSSKRERLRSLFGR